MIVRDAQLAAGGTGLETLGRFSSRTAEDSKSSRCVPRIEFANRSAAIGHGTDRERRGFGWKPIADGPYVFESLQAHGVLQKGKLVLQDIDTNFLGGVPGTLLVDWTNGLAVAGDAALTRLSAGRFGEVIVPPPEDRGDLRWKRQAAGRRRGLGRIAGNPGGFHGFGNNPRIPPRRRSRRGSSRGSGRYHARWSDQIRKIAGYLRFTPTEASSSDLKLSAGLLTAEGQFTARAGGRVEATPTS